MCSLGECESRKKMANCRWTGRVGLKCDIELEGMLKGGRRRSGCESCTDPLEKLSQRIPVLGDCGVLQVTEDEDSEGDWGGI